MLQSIKEFHIRGKMSLYDFPYNFSGIVGGYGLRCLRSRCVRTSCDFLCGHLATNRVHTEKKS